ncbi:peptidoglycan-binding protein [Frankia sp. AgB32]|uniref:peptidoglycan-binding domain-containing protein n=1 Tax=Frankia sp. AgB32 TaxID=631119 RepID=UPI00200C6733|nr:peptidoglycan-binding domain-containing protein [Frankia sp. AgB32]MCK9897896.1 peptidoglycan-binding protein [Frankia sp. AgB32]
MPDIEGAPQAAAAATDDLAETVRATLRALVPPGGTSALAFQPVPTPLNLRDYLRPGSDEVEPVRAGIQLSLVADTVGEIIDGDLVTGTTTASGLFGLLLTGTANGTPDAAAVYGRLRGAAEERYRGDPHLILPTPASWCVPGVLGWSNFSWKTGDSSGGGLMPSTERVPGPEWQWRVLGPEYRAVLGQPRLITQAASTDASGAGQPAPDGARLRNLAALAQADGPPALGGAVTLNDTVVLPAVEQPLADPRHVVQVAGSLDLAATPHVADSSSLSVSFKFAFVTLRRPWWDGLLVRNRGWRIAGYAPGSLSPGPDSTSGPAVGLPVGMVLVRDVAISGTWSSDQTQVVENSISFGPFSLLGRTISTESVSSTTTMTVDGTQLCAWLVEVLPKLPPSPDEAPPAAPRELLKEGSRGPNVERLQRQLAACGCATFVTGRFDHATVEAVVAFQREKRLKVDGIVGPHTWVALFGTV